MPNGGPSPCFSLLLHGRLSACASGLWSSGHEQKQRDQKTVGGQAETGFLQTVSATGLFGSTMNNNNEQSILCQINSSLCLYACTTGLSGHLVMLITLGCLYDVTYISNI